MLNIVRKHTSKGNSYWASNGAYTKEMQDLFTKLVPSENEADTIHGELIRGINRLTYDWGNNGNCNAIEEIRIDCPECNGSGYEENRFRDEDEDEMRDCSYCGGDCQVVTGLRFDNYFNDMVEFIEDNLPHEEKHVIEKFKNVVLERDNTNGDEEQAYNDLADSIMYTVLTTENKKR